MIEVRLRIICAKHVAEITGEQQRDGSILVQPCKDCERETKEAQIKAEAEKQKLDNERTLREEKIRLENEVRATLTTQAQLKEAKNQAKMYSSNEKNPAKLCRKY